MLINKGDRWAINTSGADNLEVEILSDINTDKDTYKTVKIIRGEQKKRNGTILKSGDDIEIRTTRTEFLSLVSTAITS